MARVGVAIVKRVSFRGFAQEFSNVYFYECASLPNASAAGVLIDNVKSVEVPLHSTDVTFVRGLCWSAGGTPVSNAMIHQKALTGTGSQATDTTMDRERAVLVQWPAGVNIKGRPVTLKKWYHSCGSCAGASFSASEKQQTSALAGTTQTAIAAQANLQTAQTSGGAAFNLCAASGRANQGGATVNRWLEHHQLGDAWR